jgi:hypothetical protein
LELKPAKERKNSDIGLHINKALPISQIPSDFLFSLKLRGRQEVVDLKNNVFLKNSVLLILNYFFPQKFMIIIPL